MSWGNRVDVKDVPTNDVAHEAYNASVIFKTAYGPSRRVRVVSLPLRPGDRRGAVQSFAQACDINRIMAKYQLTGSVEWVQKHEGRYADVTGLSFDSAMETVLRAQAMFDDLPSSVRARFGNDPGAFFDFVNDPNSGEELVRLGLAVKRPDEPAPVVPAVPAGS